MIIAFFPSREIHKDIELESHFHEPNSPLEMRLHATKRRPVQHAQYVGLSPAAQISQWGFTKKKANTQRSSHYIDAHVTQVEQVHPPSPGARAQARHTQTLPLTGPPGLVWIQSIEAYSMGRGESCVWCQSTYAWLPNKENEEKQHLYPFLLNSFQSPFQRTWGREIRTKREWY